MTLKTRFYVTTPGIDPQAIWDLLMAHVETESTVPNTVYTEPTEHGQTLKSTRRGSGRNALCRMYYTESEEELSRHPSETDDPELEDDDVHYNPHAYIELSFETAYGYRGPDGEDCSALHRTILLSLASYVTSHGGEFIWNDEYTGVWHTGIEPISTLGEI